MKFTRKKKAKSYDELLPDMLQDYMTQIKKLKDRKQFNKLLSIQFEKVQFFWTRCFIIMWNYSLKNGQWKLVETAYLDFI